MVSANRPSVDDAPKGAESLSRNARYEQRRKASGLTKVTLWVPESLESEFRMLAEACCLHRHLSFNTLRDTVSGKYVSLERLGGGDVR